MNKRNEDIGTVRTGDRKRGREEERERVRERERAVSYTHLNITNVIFNF